MKHTIFKVQDGKQNDWRSWCEHLSEHELEAKETMREENCVYERAIIYELDRDHYVIGTCLFDGEPKKANLEVALNVQHQKMKSECLKLIAKFEGEFILPTTCETLYEFDLR